MTTAAKRTTKQQRADAIRQSLAESHLARNPAELAAAIQRSEELAAAIAARAKVGA